MVTADDIAAAVGGLYAGSAAFAAAAPGGPWNTQGPDVPAAYPYAVFKITGGGPLWNSGPIYTQVFRVAVAAYAPVGDSGVDQTAVQQALWTAVCRQTPALRTPATQRVLAILPSAAEARYDPARRDGKDVFVAGYTFDIQVQGDSSTA